MGLLRKWSLEIGQFVKENFTEELTLPATIGFKILFLCLVFIVIDFISVMFWKFFSRFLVNVFKSKPILKEAYKQKAWRSIGHFFSLFFVYLIYDEIFAVIHPKTHIYVGRLIVFGQVMVIAFLAYRFAKALENYYIQNKDNYRITAIKALSETIRIFGTVVFSLIGIFVIFGIELQTVLGVLGAVTAVILLVFRDTILGFVTGIHVSTSKNLKIGDWIGIPKYNIEGNIQDINLLTTKIVNFDKTISTIPTYDLLSTEIRNHQVMYEGSSRRIKRSIYFNIKSFKFVDDEFYEKVKLLG